MTTRFPSPGASLCTGFDQFQPDLASFDLSTISMLRRQYQQIMNTLNNYVVQTCTLYEAGNPLI